MWFIMLTWLLENHMPYLSLVGPLINFWLPKQLPMGMAMYKLHPLTHAHMVNGHLEVTCPV